MLREFVNLADNSLMTWVVGCDSWGRVFYSGLSQQSKFFSRFVYTCKSPRNGFEQRRLRGVNQWRNSRPPESAHGPDIFGVFSPAQRRTEYLSRPASFTHNGGLRLRFFLGRGGNCSPVAAGIGANLFVFAERRDRGEGQEALRRLSARIGRRLVAKYCLEFKSGEIATFKRYVRLKKLYS